MIHLMKCFSVANTLAKVLRGEFVPLSERLLAMRDVIDVACYDKSKKSSF